MADSGSRRGHRLIQAPASTHGFSFNLELQNTSNNIWVSIICRPCYILINITVPLHEHKSYASHMGFDATFSDVTWVSWHLTLQATQTYLWQLVQVNNKETYISNPCKGKPPVTDGFPAQGTRDAENASTLWRHYGCLRMSYISSKFLIISYQEIHEVWSKSCISFKV